MCREARGVRKSGRRTVAKNATLVSYLFTCSLGPYLELMSDPELLLTTNSNGGKNWSSVCSARAKPSGSSTASRASGPRVSSPGGGGGLARQSKTTFGSRQSMLFKNVMKPSDDSLLGQNSEIWWYIHEIMMSSKSMLSKIELSQTSLACCASSVSVAELTELKRAANVGSMDSNESPTIFRYWFSRSSPLGASKRRW